MMTREQVEEIGEYLRGNDLSDTAWRILEHDAALRQQLEVEQNNGRILNEVARELGCEARTPLEAAKQLRTDLAAVREERDKLENMNASVVMERAQYLLAVTSQEHQLADLQAKLAERDK